MEYWAPIIIAIGSVVTTIIATLGGIYLRKISFSMKEVHVAVNSERAAMLAQVEELKDKVLKLTVSNTKLQTDLDNKKKFKKGD